MYISLDKSNTENIWEIIDTGDTTKEQRFPGLMKLTRGGLPDGDVYEMSLSRHGNSSWYMCKKRSYNIIMSYSDSLLGLKI